jgi:hypothetical protein
MGMVLGEGMMKIRWISPAEVSCMNMVSWFLDSKNIMRVVGKSLSKLIISSGFSTIGVL